MFWSSLLSHYCVANFEHWRLNKEIVVNDADDDDDVDNVSDDDYDDDDDDEYNDDDDDDEYNDGGDDENDNDDDDNGDGDGDNNVKLEKQKGLISKTTIISALRKSLCDFSGWTFHFITDFHIHQLT